MATFLGVKRRNGRVSPPHTLPAPRDNDRVDLAPLEGQFSPVEAAPAETPIETPRALTNLDLLQLPPDGPPALQPPPT